MWFQRSGIFGSLFALTMLLIAGGSVAANDVVVVHPSSINIENGKLNYGELSFLTESDIDTYDIDSSPNADASSTNHTVVWTAAAIVDSPSTVSSIRVEIAGHYSQPSVTQKVSLYNYTTSSWHNFDTRLAGDEVDEVIILNVDRDYVADDGTLQVRVTGLRDKSFTSWANLITWTLAYDDADLPSTHESVIFNEARGLSVVEGSFDDWASKTPFGEDAEDIHEPNSPLDWRKVWMAHDGGFFWFAYTNYGDVNQSWGQTIYLDTDINSSTGWQSGLAMGADYVIQSNLVYKYIGNAAGTEWEWELIRAISYGGFTGGAEFRFPRRDIGDPEIMYVAYVGSNEPYGGTAEDLFPDSVYSAKGGARYFVYTTNESLATNGNTVPTDGGNTAPVANNIVVQAVEFEPVDFTVSASDADGDELTYSIVSGDGTLDGDGPSYSFVPDIGGTTYEFTYRAFDGTQYSNEATISIRTSFFDIPLLDVVDYHFEVNSDESIQFNIGSADPALYYIEDAMFGTLTGEAPNLTYTPDTCCQDEFIYYSTDTVEGWISISVLASDSSANASQSGFNDNIVVDGSTDEWVVDYISGFGNFDDQNPAEVDGARLAHDETSLYINHTSGISLLSDVDEKAYFVYLDTDESASTGYRGIREIGAEFMVQGSSLYQYAGDGNSFDWTYLGDVERAISGYDAELKIDRFALGNPASLNVVFVADNLIPEVGGGLVYIFPTGDIDGDMSGFYGNFFTYTFGDVAVAQDTLSFDAAHAEPVAGLSSLLQSPRQPGIDPLNVDSTDSVASVDTNTGKSGGGLADMLGLIALSGLIGMRRRCRRAVTAGSE